MKRIIAFSLLCLFINSSMLLPQVDESCLHHSCGKQSNHVNSLLEWVDEVLLEHVDTTPEDEDDENTFINSMIDETCCHRSQQKHDLQPHQILLTDACKFAEYAAGKLPSLILDVTAPPPERMFESFI
jgi:hypothetical protein